MWYMPEPVGKPHQLAKELVRNGHEVTVITGFPNYPKGEVFSNYKKKCPFFIEHRDGVRIIRIRGINGRGRRASNRMLAMSSYSLQSFIVAVLLFERYDAVWSYQLAYPAMAYSFFTGVPHLHEIQDLWPFWGEGALTGLNALLLRALVNLQRAAYIQANALSTISEGFSRIIPKLFHVKKSKIAIIPNWAEEKVFGRAVGRVGRSELGLPDGFIITYGGNVGTAQALSALIRAADRLRAYDDIYIVIIGDGIEKESLVKLSARLGLSHVVFFPRQAPEQMGRFFSISDVLFIGLADHPKYNITIPSKLYSYLLAGKPILAAVAGDTAAVIEMNGIGFVCKPESDVQIADTILKAYSSSHDSIKRMGEAAKELAARKFSGAIISKQYEDAFASIIVADNRRTCH
jgi:glycosyltransferase involved in cell wall biosynthesis